MRWLTLQDDELPTWVHTTLTMAIVSFFAAPLFWYGVPAIMTGHIEPISGPELGNWWFGNKPHDGTSAVIAGWSLVAWGATFIAVGMAWCRWAEDRMIIRLLPWLLASISILFTFWAPPGS